VTQKSGNLQEVFATGPESAFNFARGFMGFRKLMEDGSAANTHALVEVVSSCRSEYDNFGALEVDRRRSYIRRLFA